MGSYNRPTPGGRRLHGEPARHAHVGHPAPCHTHHAGRSTSSARSAAVTPHRDHSLGFPLVVHHVDLVDLGRVQLQYEGLEVESRRMVPAILGRKEPEETAKLNGGGVPRLRPQPWHDGARLHSQREWREPPEVGKEEREKDGAGDGGALRRSVGGGRQKRRKWWTCTFASLACGVCVAVGMEECQGRGWLRGRIARLDGTWNQIERCKSSRSRQQNSACVLLSF